MTVSTCMASCHQTDKIIYQIERDTLGYFSIIIYDFKIENIIIKDHYITHPQLNEYIETFFPTHIVTLFPQSVTFFLFTVKLNNL